jgi:hypothetical protein
MKKRLVIYSSVGLLVITAMVFVFSQQSWVTQAQRTDTATSLTAQLATMGITAKVTAVGLDNTTLRVEEITPPLTGADAVAFAKSRFRNDLKSVGFQHVVISDGRSQEYIYNLSTDKWEK